MAVNQFSDGHNESYCAFVQGLPPENPHREYHDFEYGFPLVSDDELFGRLLLEINQAGLSWITILRKKENFRVAYAQFHVQRVAAYGAREVELLLDNPGIIRNRRKIEAAISNARSIVELQKEFGSFRNWLNAQGMLNKEDWVRLFKQNFTFTGGEITGEFLMSTGYLEGAHHKHCPVYKEVLRHNPRWNQFV